MSLSTLINRPCTLVRRSPSGGTDDYGNAVASETLTSTVCEIQQLRRNEPGEAGEFSVAEWTGFFPAGTDLDTGDAILVDAHRFEVVGAPWPARNPRTQADSHVEASLRKAAGSEDVS